MCNKVEFAHVFSCQDSCKKQKGSFLSWYISLNVRKRNEQLCISERKSLGIYSVTVGVGEGSLFWGMRKGKDSILPSIEACIHERWILHPFGKDCLASTPVCWVKIDKGNPITHKGRAAGSSLPIRPGLALLPPRRVQAGTARAALPSSGTAAPGAICTAAHLSRSCRR